MHILKLSVAIIAASLLPSGAPSGICSNGTNLRYPLMLTSDTSPLRSQNPGILWLSLTTKAQCTAGWSLSVGTPGFPQWTGRFPFASTPASSAALRAILCTSLTGLVFCTRLTAPMVAFYFLTVTHLGCLHPPGSINDFWKEVCLSFLTA